MRKVPGFVIAGIICVPLFSQDLKPAAAPTTSDARRAARRGDAWKDELKDRTQRGTLQDTFQHVRGDTGRWSDEPSAQHAPPLDQKPAKMTLDDWFDQLLEKKRPPPTRGDDNWILCRTRQLDDNDRLWVERVERQESKFTIILKEAVWQGRYFKTFTWYGVYGVNLGKLEPGEYEVTWVIESLMFKQFDGDGRPVQQGTGAAGKPPRDNWPKDETPAPADKKPVKLRVTFQVAAGTPP